MQAAVVIAHCIQVVINRVVVQFFHLNELSYIQILDREVNEVSHLLLGGDLGHS